MKDSIIETQIARLYWEDEVNGIVFGETKPNILISLENTKELLDAYANHFPHPNRKIIIDFTELSGATKEAREYFVKHVYDHFNAVAVLSYSKFDVGAVIVRVSLVVYNLRKPTKMFYTKEEAMDWLMSIK